MTLNQTQVAKLVDRYAGIKAKEAAVRAEADLLATKLKKIGGGQSDKWSARLVRIDEKVMTVRAHKQLRLFAK